MTQEKDVKMSQAYEEYLETHLRNVNICGVLLTGKPYPEHDLSKYDAEEIEGYERRFFPEGKELTEEDKAMFQEAWLHHIHHNPHHWQYWVIPEEGPVPMPERYVQEMVCDWGSFAVKSGDAYELIRFWNKKKSSYVFHPDTRPMVEKYVQELYEKLVAYLKAIA